MPAEEIPDHVRRLIADRIDSVPQLEALLLFREYRARTWTASQASARLYVSRILAAQIIGVLEQRGFLVIDGDAFRYAPASHELEVSVDALAVAYSHHLVAVTELVHAKPGASARRTGRRRGSSGS
jgi:hypothetical protein